MRGRPIVAAPHGRVWAVSGAGTVIVLAGAWIAGARLLPNHLPLGVAVQGAVIGSLDALVALGLVLVYRSARIVNFAQAGIGALGGAAGIVAMIGLHLEFFVAVAVGIAVAVAAGAAADGLVSWRFASAPRLILTVATIGLQQVFGAFATAIPEPFHLSAVTTFTAPFHVSWEIGPVIFGANDLLALLVVPIVLAGLWWFLERTDTGIAIRGAADSPERAALLGIRARHLSRVTWMVAAGISGIGALLAAPITFPALGVVAGPQSLLLPLAAAVVGGMESLPVTFAAAIVLGVFQQAAFWSYPHASFVDLGIFVVILAALVFQPFSPLWLRSRGRDDTVEVGDHVAFREVRQLPALLARLPEVRAGRAVLGAAILAAAVLVPVTMSESQLILLADIVIFAIVGVSLVVLSGWSGQVSLGQFAFVGVGAATTGALLVHAHADLWLTMVAASAVGGAVAVVIGLPALRMPGLFLAVTTLAFAVPVSTWLLNAGNFPAINPPDIARPILFGRISLGSSLAFYELCLAVLVGALLAVRNLRRSRPGRTIIAIRDNPRASALFAIHPVRTRLFAFAASGAIAGAAGCLYVVSLRGLGTAGIAPEASLAVFTMVVLGGLGSLTGAVVGAVYVELVSTYLSNGWQLLGTGAGILVVLAFLPEGLGDVVFRARDLLLRRLARRRGLELGTREAAGGADRFGGVADDGPPGSHEPGGREVPDRPAPGAAPAGEDALSCSGIEAAYGAVRVLAGVDLAVSTGEVLALLGTNGAGKSTALRVLAGVHPATAGRVLLGATDITSWDAPSRVAAGLVMVPGGRGVFGSLTVAENLHLAGWSRRRSDPDGLAADHRRVLDLFPALAARLGLRARMLSGGEKQMLALAQALLCRPKVLLVDELSLGLAPNVVAGILAVLRGLARDGVCVVVVEQSVNVASAVAWRCVFMERGRIRFEGRTPDLAAQPDLARSVFLGSAAASMHDGGSGGGGGGGGREGAPVPPRENAAGSVLPREKTGAVARHTDGVPSYPSAAPALEVAGVAVRYGAVAALSDVSFHVAPGEVLGIIGANGAGKTTLFDVCCGFVRYGSGRVLVSGEDVTARPPTARAALGMGRIFQDARLFPSLTVAETLAVSLERFVEVRDPLLSALRTIAVETSEAAVAARVEELIDEMGLGAWRDHFVAELSTGTRRVVELAAMLAHRPALVLMDEPSSGIAQRETEALAQLLERVRVQTGAAMVVIEHDIPLVASLADRLVCLHLGEVLAEGRCDEVLGDPAVIAAYLGTESSAIARSGISPP